MFREAHKLYVDGHEDQALSRYIYLAALGFEVANFNAAFILEKAKDLKHLKRATFFYSRSGKMDNSEARRKVGDAFYKVGDPISAVAHYILASKLSNPDPEALFNLGYAYESGIGLRKDLWSALDMYTACLSQGKSGKIAVGLAMTKVHFKIFLNTLLTLNSQKPRQSTLKSKSKSQKESDKLLSMIATLIITSLIYFYVNIFLPRQQRRTMEARNRVDDSASPETQASSSTLSVNSDSDSSSEAEFVAFRFQKCEESENIEANESDEVD